MPSIFDIIVLASLGIFGFLGLKNGLIDELGTLFGFILAIIFSSSYYYIGTNLVNSLFNINESLAMVLGYIIIFVVVYLTCIFIAWILHRFLKKIKLDWLNKIAGLIFGVFKGVLIMATIVWIINVFNDFGLSKKLSAQSVSYNFLKDFTCSVAQFLGYEEKLNEMAKAIRNLFGLQVHI